MRVFVDQFRRVVLHEAVVERVAARPQLVAGAKVRQARVVVRDVEVGRQELAGRRRGVAAPVVIILREPSSGHDRGIVDAADGGDDANVQAAESFVVDGRPLVESDVGIRRVWR
eukprot:6339777-Prymnesium_polylepis.1